MLEVFSSTTFVGLDYSPNEFTDNSFLSNEFFLSLEKSKSIGKGTGWIPFPIIVKEGGVVVGCMPIFLKEHSYGEYIFDWAWAEAFQRHGLNYYPKLVCAIPFSPVTGPRILAKNKEVKDLLVKALEKIMHQHKISSCHFLFTNKDDQKILNKAGWMHRQGVQFRWENKEYKNFDDFLKTLSHRKRKKIRQERKRVDGYNLTILRKLGSNISKEDLCFMYECYCQTYALHHSSPYLTKDFFITLHKLMPEKLLIIQASKDHVPIASALNIISDNKLYGRYWGAIEYIPNLHFELCYYQGQEFCIENSLEFFEGGAQGEHKIARGFAPFDTFSSHYIVNNEFREAISNFLNEEENRMNIYMEELEERLPFKQK
jgi:predicted N-acyltransferase